VPGKRPLSRPAATLAASFALGLAIYGGSLVPLPDARMSGFLWIGLSGVAFVLIGLVRPRVELRLPRVWGVPTGTAPGRIFWTGAVLAAMLNAAGLVIWAQAGDPNLAWFLYGSSLATLLIVGWLAVGGPRPRLVGPPRVGRVGFVV
jgi:hypothetical protein